MDTRAFTRAISEPISRRLAGSYELRIDLDELPTSVEFTVISDEFEGMDPADRIQFLADVVKETFGLPLTFTPMGLALTPAEVTSGEWDEDESDEDYAHGSDEEPAPSVESNTLSGHD